MEIIFCNLRDPLEVLDLHDWVPQPARPEFKPTYADNYHELEVIVSGAKIRFSPSHALQYPKALVTATVRIIDSVESLHSITLRSDPLSFDELFSRSQKVIKNWEMHTPRDFDSDWKEEGETPENLDGLVELDRWRNGSGPPLFSAETKERTHPTIRFLQLVILPIPESKSLFTMVVHAYWERLLDAEGRRCGGGGNRGHAQNKGFKDR